MAPHTRSSAKSVHRIPAVGSSASSFFLPLMGLTEGDDVDARAVGDGMGDVLGIGTAVGAGVGVRVGAGIGTPSAPGSERSSEMGSAWASEGHWAQASAKKC